MSRYFLGVDVGGTKSHALVTDETGATLGFGAAGAGNWEQVGWDGLETVLHEIVGAALAQAGLTPGQIAGAGFGLAGFDFPEDRAPHQRIVDTLALGGPTHIGNDALVALVAGAPAGWGVVVTAGTSNNTLARDRFGNEAAAFGQGARFGENGGATEMVQRAVQQVALARTGRRPATELTDVFVAHVGATDVDDLLAGLIRGRYELSSDDAPLIFATAAAGDPVANEIIAWSGDELGDLACGAIRRLGMEGEVFDVVLAGSLYKGSPVIAERLLATVQTLAPRAKSVRLESPPVIGGVLLGMEEAGADGTEARRTLAGFDGV